MSWTLERVDKLKQLWGKGNTAGQIASIIGEVTRNAVIGKAYRLNLAAKSIQKKITLIKFHSIKKMLHNLKEKYAGIDLNHCC